MPVERGSLLIIEDYFAKHIRNLPQSVSLCNLVIVILISAISKRIFIEEEASHILVWGHMSRILRRSLDSFRGVGLPSARLPYNNAEWSEIGLALLFIMFCLFIWVNASYMKLAYHNLRSLPSLGGIKHTLS